MRATLYPFILLLKISWEHDRTLRSDEREMMGNGPYDDAADGRS